MVDAERPARVRGDVARIRPVEAAHDLTTDDTAVDAVEYGFVTAIEGCVRAAAHIVASDALGVPESNADAIRLLGRRRVVPVEVAEPVARAVGLRNLLVHEYAEIDDDLVRADVALLPDLDAPTAALADWATRAG